MVDRKARLARQWSNQQLSAVSSLFIGSVVNISGADDEDKEGGSYRDYFSGASSYSVTNFTTTFRGFKGRPDEIFLDLEATPLDSSLVGRFDVGLCHTTLEHVFDVTTAFNNLVSICKEYLILVVPFAQVEHGPPHFGDYWRFTPMGVESLIERSGWTVVSITGSDMPQSAVYIFAVAAATKELAEAIRSKMVQSGAGSESDASMTGRPLGSWIGDESLSVQRRILRRLSKAIKSIRARDRSPSISR